MARKPGLGSLLRTALEAARTGAEVLLKGYGLSKSVFRLKGPTDPVTEFDEASERVVRGVIARDWPDHSILAEEGGASGPDSPWRWYIDPLDGTRNFTRRLPAFAVSVGCALIEPPAPPRPLVGVVLAPVARELFWGSAGRGAFLRQDLPGGFVQRRLSAASGAELSQAVVVVGQPYDFHERPEAVLGPINRAAKAVAFLRHSGSAALDLCYVAAGRFDAYFEPGLKAWDVAAGAVILAEAGGVLTGLAGGPFELEGSGDVLAASAGTHRRLVEILDWKG